MTLPASGSISWNQICAEFGLNPTTAVFPRDFYGKGGAPSSGALSFADFYGRSNFVAPTFSPGEGYYSYDTQFAAQGAGVSVISGGPVTWQYSKMGAGIQVTPTSGSSSNQLTINANKLSSGSVSVDAYKGGVFVGHWDFGFGDGGMV